MSENIFKNQTLSLIIRTLLLVLNTIALGFYLSSKAWPAVILIAFLGVILFFSLINFFLRLNEKVAYFFKAVKNKDSSLVYNEKIGGKAFKELHANLNRVNKLIQKSSIKSQTKEQFYKSLINHAATGLLSFNKQGQILELNHSAKALLPIYYARRIRDYENLDPALPDFIRGLSTGNPKIFPLRIDGQLKQLIFKVSKYKQGTEEIRLLSIENIKAELDHKELESWVKLIRVLTHEIMNSVAPIISMSDTANNILEQNAKQSTTGECGEYITDAQEAIQAIKEQTTGLKKFVESYRELTKLPQPEYKKLEIGGFLNKMVFILKESCQQRFDIKCVFRPPNLSLLADEELMGRVVYNLGLNAIQAMEESGVGDELVLEAYQNNYNNVIIKIADNGPGMRDEVKERAFIPFYTTRDHGSGIGLSLCQQIIHLHKGEIDLDSNVGGGTRFYLKL